MQKIIHHRFCKSAFFAGLTAAVILAACASMILGAKKPFRRVPLETLDAQAQPFFNRARKNVPDVVRKLTTPSSVAKICILMAQDQIFKTEKTAGYLNSILAVPIVAPCIQGAKTYGCDLHSLPFQDAAHSVLGDDITAAAYASGGLALEAIFIRQTIESLRLVLGCAVSKLVASYSGGATCAAADGPLPIGDAVGVTLAVGGTIWCACDLYSACKRLSSDLTEALDASITDCQTACRMAVAK